MTLSVIVPAYNAQDTLPDLLDSLTKQIFHDFEVIIVDDCSTDKTADLIEASPFKLIKLSLNKGPAFCRNVGAQQSHGDLIVFTDSDCTVDRQWLGKIKNYFEQNDFDALMGRLFLRPSSYLGDSISALGFPAGGSLGFEKVWKVDDNGYTNTLSSCNCAIRREVFDDVGGFDDSFPYAGGEDTFFAYSLNIKGYKIKYCPDVIAIHEARGSLKGFIKWQFQRGISGYIFSKMVDQKSRFLSTRLWAMSNVIRYNMLNRKIPLIVVLMVMSVFFQVAGAFSVKLKDKK